MPAAKPPEFRRRAGELARRREKSIAEPPTWGSRSRTCGGGWSRTRSTPAASTGCPPMSGPSWSGCAGRTGCRRWRSRSSSGPVPTSPGGPSPV